MSATPVDHAQAHETEMLQRLSAALSGLEKLLDHDDKEARHTSWACRLILIGALTAPRINSVQGWTYVRSHVVDCLHDDTRGAEAREVYRSVLATLDGK